MKPYLCECLTCGQDFYSVLAWSIECDECATAAHEAMAASYQTWQWADSRKERLRERLGVSGDVDE